MRREFLDQNHLLLFSSSSIPSRFRNLIKSVNSFFLHVCCTMFNIGVMCDVETAAEWKDSIKEFRFYSDDDEKPK